MPLKVTFELSDADLRHFRRVMREAQANAKRSSERKILAEAKRLLESVRASEIPTFVRERLLRVDTLIAMLEDPEWALTGANRARIVNALAYFNEPIDLIPDAVPGFGYIDDAIMVELVVQDLKPDFEAYEDFCTYRQQLDGDRRAQADDVERQRSIEARRTQLHARMRRRRQRRTSGSRRSSRSPFSLW